MLFVSLLPALHVSMITSIYIQMIVFRATGITRTISCLSKIFSLGYYCNCRVNTDVLQVSKVCTIQTYSILQITQEIGYSLVYLHNAGHRIHRHIWDGWGSRSGASLVCFLLIHLCAWLLFSSHKHAYCVIYTIVSEEKKNLYAYKKIYTPQKKAWKLAKMVFRTNIKFSERVQKRTIKLKGFKRKNSKYSMFYWLV